MAILKSINTRKADMTKQKESIDYITNANKRYISEVQSFALSRNYLKSIRVNRFLHGKNGCKRYFKTYIVSLQRKRPNNKSMLAKMEMALCNVLQECTQYYIEQGIATLGAVHCNTEHMHFHFHIDTCNCLTGKQWGQSKNELAEMKAFVSSKLLEYGLEEEILCSVQNVSEEDMLLEEDIEYSFGNEDFSNTELALRVEQEPDQYLSTKEQYWNSGTMEQGGSETCQNEAKPDKSELVEMCRIVHKNEKREGSETCQNEAKPDKSELVEMCRIVYKNEEPKERVMCRIVDDSEKMKG